MASPAEIVKAWDKREAREAAAARAKRMVSNDNDEPKPDGYIETDDGPMPYWLPKPAPMEAPVEEPKKATG